MSDSVAPGAIGAFSIDADAIRAVLDGLILGVADAFLAALDAFGAVLDRLALELDVFLVAADAFGAALDGLGLALKGNFLGDPPPREPGRVPEDPGDDTAPSISGLFIVIVASSALGSLGDPDDATRSFKTSKIAEGGAADAVLICDSLGPVGDDI